MIYTLTLNPSLDYVVHVKNFELGETNRADQETIYPGGKGINVSIVLSRLGQPTIALGFLAGFTGEALKAMVQQEGIEARFVKVHEGNTRINVKLKGSVETEINGQGPHLTDADLQALYTHLDDIGPDDVLVISGSIPKSLPGTLYLDILNRVHKHVGKIVVDAEGELLLKTLPLHPFLIKPNRAELEGYFDTKLNSIEEVIAAARKLQDMGACNVLVSMGGDGAVFVSQNGAVYSAKAPQGELKNSVGAGDSMVAGFLAGYLSTGSFWDAFKVGVCAGSATAFDDGLALKKDVDALLHQNAGLFKQL